MFSSSRHSFMHHIAPHGGDYTAPVLSQPLNASMPSVLIEVMRGGEPSVRLSEQAVRYMYAPVISSLVAVFHAAGPVEPMVNFASEQDVGSAAALRRGDLFIFVGMHGVRHMTMARWQGLRKRGIRTAYYQSEPRQRCFVSDRTMMDEVWDFSWYNLDICRNHTHDPPLLRYVPLVALQGSPRVRYQPNRTCTSLVFFGGAYDRDRCLSFLKTSIDAAGDEARFRSVYNVWSESDFDVFLTQAGVGIFVNIHRHCRVVIPPAATPVTWRNPVLLNAHAIVISERCYWKDEMQFAGLIDFSNVTSLPKAFFRLRAMTAGERQALAESRHAAFAERFRPSKVSVRAGLPQLLQALQLFKTADESLDPSTLDWGDISRPAQLRGPELSTGRPSRRLLSGENPRAQEHSEYLTPRPRPGFKVFHSGSPVCANALNADAFWNTLTLLPSVEWNTSQEHIHHYSARGNLAVQMSGHFRDLQLDGSYVSPWPLPVLLNALNEGFSRVDLFVHTWSTLEASTTSWRKYNSSMITASAVPLAHELAHRLNPRLMMVERFDLARLKFDGDVEPDRPAGPFARNGTYLSLKSMFHGIASTSWLRRCYEREHPGAAYDLVLKLRPDPFGRPIDPLGLVQALMGRNPSCVDPWILHAPHSLPCLATGRYGPILHARPIDPGSINCGGDKVLWSAPPIFDAIFGYLDRRFDAIIHKRVPYHRMELDHRVEMIHNAMYDLHIKASRCFIEPWAKKKTHGANQTGGEYETDHRPMPIESGRGELMVDTWTVVSSTPSYDAPATGGCKRNSQRTAMPDEGNASLVQKCA